MLKMKTALHPSAALVSAEELQGLLGPTAPPARAYAYGVSAGLMMLALLGLLKFSLLLALTRLPLITESVQNAIGTYIGFRLGLELLVMGLWVLSGTTATLKRWRPVLLTVALTTLGLDLLAWVSFGL